VLSELRQYVLRPLIGNSLFSDAEQLRANHFVHECEDIAWLTRWGISVLAEITRRQAEAACVRRYLAMCASLGRFRATSFRNHLSRPYQSKYTWVPGACFPDRADRRAGTFDRLAAARFQSTDSLTLATLLSLQSR
jgi:hypothetical protein